ncbi:hypothetical protein [Sphingomonas yantingensis]|uniref:Uncharacterized protein n=1 Tax=Sphingomonas yantingensis TaxID=1241761 RepID=A0A7W9EJE7_9SPHN|nr:hypothetical protein [Sphingomonas yantingensis]MBB5700153.1 hypothetical protein [Sphingomonas yantingensis]
MTGTSPGRDVMVLRRSNTLVSAALLGALFFLPGTIGFLFEAVSFTPGTVAASIAAFVLAGVGLIPASSRNVQWSIGTIVLVAVIVLLHMLLANAIDNDPSFDVQRAFLSLALISIVILAVPAVADTIGVESRLRTIVFSLCILFFVSIIFSLLQIQPPTPSLGEKPIFPYTEPSFLGFSVAAVLIFTVMRMGVVARLATIMVFLGLGFALANLTVIAAVLLAAMVALPLSWLGGGLAVFVVAAASLDLSYYTERLDFDWANSNNISALVYVQGWQMLQESLERTYGWGVGFQQLGVVYTNVPASFRINALLGRDANLQDGGFILSKIGSEFGMIGLALATALVIAAMRSFARLRLMSRQAGRDMPDGELFARACVIGYLIELLVRGTNYLTGTLVLMLAGLLYLYRLHAARSGGERPA